MIVPDFTNPFLIACCTDIVTEHALIMCREPGRHSNLDKGHEEGGSVCRYALKLAEHVLDLIQYAGPGDDIIKEGFLVNERWQNGTARMHDVRQAGFKIHRLAKASEDIMVSSALRAAGHAVAAGHMKQHAMVASDYAVKVINLLYPDNMDAVRQERLWQINQLNEIRKAD